MTKRVEAHDAGHKWELLALAYSRLSCSIEDVSTGVYVVTISADGEVVYSAEVMKE